MAPIDAVDTLPYAVVNWRALSPTNCSIARRSFKSRSSSPLSSAILKTRASTPCWVAFKPNKRASSSGPRSEIVARTGNPRRPSTSQNTVGFALHDGSPSPVDFRRSRNFGVADPAADRPERSPLTSARNTGTPSREKLSASTCNVTVLPVPVAPVTRPWRFASAGRNWSSVPLEVLARRNGSVMRGIVTQDRDGSSGCAQIRDPCLLPRA